MKIGIFFGGPSREREISFAGGRTVYDNLDKALFEAVPVFVDSSGNFILLNWEFVYKGTIRDFYPPVSALPRTEVPVQLYFESLGELSATEQDAIIAEVGRRVEPRELATLIDFAFLALHGPGGEDGAIQGLLEWYGIPYSGSGILPSAFGIDKIAQKKLLKALGQPTPDFPPDYGRGMGRRRPAGYPRLPGARTGFAAGVQGPAPGQQHRHQHPARSRRSEVQHRHRTQPVPQNRDAGRVAGPFDSQKITWLQQLVDIREGIGLPVTISSADSLELLAVSSPLTEANSQRLTDNSLKIIYRPEELLEALNTRLATQPSVQLTSVEGETQVLVESFVQGPRVLVHRGGGRRRAAAGPAAYRDCEGRGNVRLPLEIPARPGPQNHAHRTCPKLISSASARPARRCTTRLASRCTPGLDGFIQTDGTIFLNDPNTTSGMLPASFFFHQAAEIGLNPSQFLTFLIRTSLAARRRGGLRPVKLAALLSRLDAAVAARASQEQARTKVSRDYGRLLLGAAYFGGKRAQHL